MNAVPSIQRSWREDRLPTIVLVKQWRNFFEAGKAQNPPIAAATASAFFYLAWSVRSGAPLFRRSAPRSSMLYSTAAILTLGIVPFTVAVMKHTNEELLAKAKGDPQLSQHADFEVQSLISKWITLNGLRSLFPLAGGLAGLIAVLS
ncbi:hypothetical protein N7510_005699 [Penicillium lagena]|uniref:uncharacterized protein n=1 Tax=Penicillium lagena TaxID=94218 RepID=UPI00253FCFFD|nr:uncharacterized protein N7510_005699 [Penicillium lagena]KAJ5612505.1 hypothetical protein N7510_005699 [Penicillium lagena]